MCLCSHHWILAMINLKEGKISIFDPLDISESTYKEFINCIQRKTTYQPCVHHKSCYNYSY
jgi:Ulp1 family protease